MFLFNKKLTIVAFASFMMMSATNVSASGAVAGATEITQLLNNSQLLMQVMEAKAQTVAQIKQLTELYSTAKREILHLKSIGDDVTRIARLAKEKDLKNLVKMIDLTESVYGNVSGLGNRLELRYQEAYNQGLSIKDYIQNQGKLIERKEKQAIARVKQEQAFVDHLKEDLNNINDLANKIPLSEGTQQSLGLMNTQMNHLLVSMNRIAQVMQASQENVQKAQAESDAIINERHGKKFAEQIDAATDKANNTTFNPNIDPMAGAKLNGKKN